MATVQKIERNGNTFRCFGSCANMATRTSGFTYGDINIDMSVFDVDVLRTNLKDIKNKVLSSYDAIVRWIEQLESQYALNVRLKGITNNDDLIDQLTKAEPLFKKAYDAVRSWYTEFKVIAGDLTIAFSNYQKSRRKIETIPKHNTAHSMFNENRITRAKNKRKYSKIAEKEKTVLKIRENEIRELMTELQDKIDELNAKILIYGEKNKDTFDLRQFAKDVESLTGTGAIRSIILELADITNAAPSDHILQTEDVSLITADVVGVGDLSFADVYKIGDEELAERLLEFKSGFLYTELTKEDLNEIERQIKKDRASSPNLPSLLEIINDIKNDNDPHNLFLKLAQDVTRENDDIYEVISDIEALIRGLRPGIDETFYRPRLEKYLKDAQETAKRLIRAQIPNAAVQNAAVQNAEPMNVG